MSDPPPTYTESMQQQQAPNYAGYQPSYGATGPNAHGGQYPPQGAPQYPPQGAPYPPQGAPYPPQGGAYPPQYTPGAKQGAGVPSYQAYQSQSTTNVVVQPQAQPVVCVGGCPSCRIGVLEEDFTCCGVLCAILFFPFGIICCLAMRQRRCGHCGAVYG